MSPEDVVKIFLAGMMFSAGAVFLAILAFGLFVAFVDHGYRHGNPDVSYNYESDIRAEESSEVGTEFDDAGIEQDWKVKE